MIFAIAIFLILCVMVYIERKYIRCIVKGHCYIQRTRYVQRCNVCRVTAYNFDPEFDQPLPPNHSRR